VPGKEIAVGAGSIKRVSSAVGQFYRVALMAITGQAEQFGRPVIGRA